MSTALALTHTPFHLLQVGAMRIASPADLGDLVLFHEGVLPDGIPGLEGAETHVLPGYTGYRTGRGIAKENIDTILGHPAWRSPHTMYASDLKWLTNNAVYFSRPAILRRDCVLFADGLGSYLDRGDFKRTRLTAEVKRALGILGVGPRHVPLRGDHFGLDSRYVRYATGFHSELLTGRVPKESIPGLEGERLPHDGAALLFVGGPLDEHKIARARAEGVVAKAIAAVADIPADRRLYKAHHFEDAWIADVFRANGFEVLQDSRPAELLMEPYRVRTICGYYSSALAFAPSLSRFRSEAVSVCFDEYADHLLNRADKEKLRSILDGFGVIFR